MIAPEKINSSNNTLPFCPFPFHLRPINERMFNLLRQDIISKWFSVIGQEAISVGTALTVSPSDYLLPMHRNLGVFTAREVPLYEPFCQLFDKKDAFTRGRDSSFHFSKIARASCREILL